MPSGAAGRPGPGNGAQRHAATLSGAGGSRRRRVLAPVAALTLGLGLLSLTISATARGGSTVCTPSSGAGVTVDPGSVPDAPIAGYDRDQLVNAAYVMQAGDELGLGVCDQTIGVMTAMGESSLVVLDRGDAAGPDSRGLFQQRANGAWGSYRDRMDPSTSSTNFFLAMVQVEGRDSLEPTIVAHRTQRNADPDHYARYWDDAVAVVEGLSGSDVSRTS